MKLAYLPIDIPLNVPDEKLVLEWFENHKLLDTNYWEYEQGRHTWTMISTCTMPEDWRRYDADMWNNRREPIQGEPDIFFHPGFEDAFPSIANCIRQLPFKQLTVSGMLYQMDEIPVHQDAIDKHNPIEPRRYTIYLTAPEHNTFYVSKTPDSEKIVLDIDPNYACFVFNNTDCFHGALKNTRPKIILTMAGIIDNEKHKALLERSLNKFKDRAVYL
jgi:L-rhamnose mutarotase